VVAAQWERAAWSPDGRRIAFTASYHPVWSPDGTRIYFAFQPEDHPKKVEFSDGSDADPAWIRSMRPDGSDRREVTSPVEGRFELPGSFSPDGRTLAFTRGAYRELGPRGRVRDVHEVWTMRPDGSEARKLAERAQDPAFSPDGRRIAFASDRDENGELAYGDVAFHAYELYVTNTDGSSPRRLTRTRGLNELQPAWMPGGKRIAYQRGTQFQNAQITTVLQANADGSCAREVFADAGIDVWYGAPAWRPGDARRGDGPLRC
jgi:TolB protein